MRLMKVLDGDIIIRQVKDLFLSLSFTPSSLDGVSFLKPEMTGLERDIAETLDTNMKIAAEEKRPLCQDCGLAQVFIEKGKFFSYSGASTIEELIEEGVRRAYDEGHLRKSMVEHPFERRNTGDNTPIFIHLEEVEGDTLKITGIAKGGGSENVSTLAMLPPSEGRKGVADFVMETLKQAGGKGCPPYFVGIGVGATFDTVASVSKKALVFRTKEDDELLKLIEARLGELDYGLLGFTGKLAVMDIFIKTAPTHIAMMPVAVTLNCHSLRSGTVTIG